MAHANARLTPAGRLTLVRRISAQPGRPVAHIAQEMGVSRTTAHRWWARYQQLGQAGLVDRPSWGTGPSATLHLTSRPAIASDVIDVMLGDCELGRCRSNGC
jgi:transposase-like protein